MSRLSTVLGALAALILFALPSVAFADDWLVTKLRGTVLQLVDNSWQPLGRGDVVSDDRVLRTMGTGRAELQRGKEVILLDPNTQVSIHDKTGKQFTTVQQYFGKVEVEAEVKNVQHFEVQTPFLAAVVKGTHFIVTSGKSSATVTVQRGKVQVTDEHTGARTYVTIGQKATVTGAGTLKLEGKGVLSEITDKAGNIISAATTSTSSSTTVTVGSVASVTVGGNTNVTVGGGSLPGVSVSTGGGGTSADVTVPGVADTHVGVDSGGVDVGANVGGVTVGVTLGGGGSSGSNGGSGSGSSGDSGGGGLLGLHLGL